MKSKNKIFTKAIISLILITASTSVFITYRTYKSFIQQAIMTYDFNNRRFNLASDEFINEIIVDIPNISATTIPLKAFKALYLRDTRKDVEGSKALLKKAINDNPYIKIPETELSRIYFDEQIADSAIYYGKKAFYGIPKNPIHFGHYAAALSLKRDTSEIKTAYKIIDWKANFLINKIYLIAMSDLIDKETSNNISDAIEYLNVSDDEYKISYYILQHGRANVSKAITLGLEGDHLFESKRFKEASLKYIEAIKYNPSEPAFYQNAGNSLLQISELDQADFYLKKSIDEFNDEKGKSEYLYAISQLERGEKENGCEFAKKAIQNFGNKEASFLYKNFCN